MVTQGLGITTPTRTQHSFVQSVWCDVTLIATGATIIAIPTARLITTLALVPLSTPRLAETRTSRALPSS